jgi:hypothetical protein
MRACRSSARLHLAKEPDDPDTEKGEDSCPAKDVDKGPQPCLGHKLPIEHPLCRRRHRHRCKLICRNCGYFLRSADFY